jgi:hypothetical protein
MKCALGVLLLLVAAAACVHAGIVKPGQQDQLEALSSPTRRFDRRK